MQEEFLYFEVTVASEDITAAFVDITKAHCEPPQKGKMDRGSAVCLKNDRFYK